MKSVPIILVTKGNFLNLLIAGQQQCNKDII